LTDLKYYACVVYTHRYIVQYTVFSVQMCTQQKARCLKNINLSICIPMATKIIKRSPRSLNEMQSDLKKLVNV